MITIIPLNNIGSDARGATYTFQNERTGEFIFIIRKPGSISGNEYHTGKHPYKNPEKIILLSGEALVEWVNMQNDEAGEMTIEGPAAVCIPSMVWHRITAISDLMILEQNGLDAAKDTIKLLQHPHLQKVTL